MSSNTLTEPQKEKTGTDRPLFEGLLKIAVFVVVSIALFFLCAGRLNLLFAWIYIATVLVSTAITSLIMDPELIAERLKIKKDAKRWDILPAILIGRVGPLVILAVSGLDARFAWSPHFPLAFQVMAFAIAVLGLFVTDWAVVSN